MITSFITIFLRPTGGKHGAVFAIMVDLNADYECRGIDFCRRADAGIRVQDHDDFYSVHEQTAKTVTSLLMLPSVLGVRAILRSSQK